MTALKIDYHLHPNLPKNNKRALKKAQRWWDKIVDNEINCIVVTEHCFKNPKRAFELMNKTKPENTFCFPGLEYTTKDSADIIIFSDTKDIYDIKELQKTFLLTYKEVLDIVKSRKDLHCFIPHPHIVGTTSIINNLGCNEYKRITNEVKAVEISNGCFGNIENLNENFVFKKLFRKKFERIKKVKNLPKNEYPKTIKLLTAGSDAHHPNEIGNHYRISSNEKITSKNEIFQIITNNKGEGLVITRQTNFSIKSLAIETSISFKEFLLKNKARVKTKIRF